ncbi:MAG TPA: MaoC family dehydratase [Thermoanaerobaculia bacterium]|nr:MaoC family dehydratase [Thermoanaerobaculia bacterium]
MNEAKTVDLARCPLTAHNYATTSENRIHGDEVARRYGFAGGLVPGVASYAYLCRPALELLGDAWLASGEISVKLVHPVYDGDTVEALARRQPEPQRELLLELRDSAGDVCATGTAALSAMREAGPTNGELPRMPTPPLDTRSDASLDELRPGCQLASVDVLDALRREGEELAADDLRRFLADRYRDPEPRYLDPSGPLHPALAPELANQVLARSVRLGPWIHAGSHTRHFAPLRPDGLHARGRVAAAYERNGHEIVDLDVRLYGFVEGHIADPEEPRPLDLLAQVLHRAIVRPRMVAAAG